MSSDLYLGIDQGSSATKAALIDGAGKTVAEWSAAVPAAIYNDRCVEQEPEGLLRSVQELFSKAKHKAGQSGAGTLRAWGLAVQRSGVLAWRADDGVPLHPMITWADTRAFPIIQGLGPGIEKISMETGLPTIANFAAPKIHLLQRKFLELSVQVATLDTFLVYRLSKGNVLITEDTMASRTMLYSLRERHWSDYLCQQFKVDKRRLPRINPSLAAHTVVDGIPLMALLGDQQAALLGRSRVGRRPLLNLGTIASLSVGTGSTPVLKPALKTNVLYSRLLPQAATREFLYVSEVTSPVTGPVLREPQRRGWCMNMQELERQCSESYSAAPAGKATAYFVNKQEHNAIWPQGIPNVMVCKPDATVADRSRALVENVGNLIAQMIEECADKGLLGESFPAQIDIAGGGSELDYLVQYLSDVTGHRFYRFAEREAGARGAALAAYMSLAGRSESEVSSPDTPLKEFSCQSPERRKRYMAWQRLAQDVLRNSLPDHAEVET